MSNRNYFDNERPSPTGGDSYNAFPTFDTPAPSFNAASNDSPNAYPTAQRSTTEPPYPYGPPVQQQETHALRATHYPYQQRSETGDAAGRTHCQTHGGAYHNRASRSSGSAYPRQSPTFDVPEGRKEGPPYYQSQDPTLRSSPSMHSHASSISQYPPVTNPAYPAGHRPSRGGDSTVAATNTHHQKSLVMSHASLDPFVSSTQGNAQLPYGRAPSTSSTVLHGVLPGTPGPLIKNRERTDVRQIEAPNRMYDCASSSPTEELNERGFGVEFNGLEGFGMGFGGLKLWYHNKRQTKRSGRRNSAQK